MMDHTLASAVLAQPVTVSGQMMQMSNAEFDAMRELIYGKFGITLSDQKRSLMVGRLQKLIRNAGFTSFDQYYQFLVNDNSDRSLSDLVDNISTNHTFFNRENDHFEFLSKTALPQVVEQLRRSGNRDLRIWCAGCSSGEEAYMLLMLIREFFGGEYSQWNGGLLATDISDRVLTTAKTGIYSDERLATLPDNLKSKYFRSAGSGQWQVVESLRTDVTFRRFNLMNKIFPFKKSFQIIFCRNVMIYFDQSTRETLVNKFNRITSPQGYLFIGHSETLGRSQGEYTYLQPAVYQKAGHV